MEFVVVEQLESYPEESMYWSAVADRVYKRQGHQPNLDAGITNMIWLGVITRMLAHLGWRYYDINKKR